MRLVPVASCLLFFREDPLLIVHNWHLLAHGGDYWQKFHDVIHSDKLIALSIFSLII